MLAKDGSLYVVFDNLPHIARLGAGLVAGAPASACGSGGVAGAEPMHAEEVGHADGVWRRTRQSGTVGQPTAPK